MEVRLAGYNVDAEVLAELAAGQNRQDVTPETISAAYARISRDPRPVNELRKIARAEVEKARRSNAAIIFKMGHHSVAEHAVFNFDILGVSRLALEEIEKFRLCSYTEKSQRYQKLEDDFVVPAEIKGSPKEQLFLETVNQLNSYYHELANNGFEPEDARYITPLATCGQLGLTVNARNLELLFRRFASHHLAEVKELGVKMFGLVSEIAPSIILFTAANDFDQKTYPEVKAAFKGRWERKRRISQACELIEHTEQADLKLLAALLHTSSGISFRNCRRVVKEMSKKEREAVVKKTFQNMEFYDAVLREFEHLSLTYDLIVSSGCFAQMKRHRMATITGQEYQPELGVTIPPKIKASREKERFLEFIRLSEKAYKGIGSPYILTSAHRKRVLMTLNARELYHVSRLREDIHAQWDIREVTEKMTKIAGKIMPLTMMLIGGKDHYADKFAEVFGHQPKVLPPKE